MITEDYVSFKVAKLLKEKGFNEKCPCLYRKKLVDNKIVDNEELFASAHLMLTNSELEDKVYKDIVYCSAPTLQMVMKWLREVYNLHCNISYHFRLSWHIRITSLKETVIDHDIEMKTYLPYKTCDYSSYEEACEEAIKYCLKDLI